MGLRTIKLQQLGREVYGEEWVYRLAKARGVAVRTAQRWASGAFEPPDDLLSELSAISEKMVEQETDRRVSELISSLQESGIPDHAIAALLRDAATALRADPDDWLERPK